MKLFTLSVFSLMIINVSSVAQTTVIDTFLFTGSVDTFVVPTCIVDSIQFDIRGAKGGNQASASGGLGGRVEGKFAVIPNDTLYIVVGQQGVDNKDSLWGVFNGGGGVFSYSSGGVSGTGGGATDIRLNGSSLNDRIVVAGGGGGAGGNGGQPLQGGAGGGLIGGDGVNWNTWSNAGGKGGTQSAGGSQGIACCGCPTHTTDGGFGYGGFGSGDNAGGAGGGSGYYGGGGACFSGAGGGSSYTASGITSVVHTQGFNNGPGMLILTYAKTIGSTSSVNQTACDSFFVGGDWQTTGGTYIDTLLDANNCDSVVTTNLTINTVDETVSQSGFTLTANESGASYQWLNCDSNYAPIPAETNQNFTATVNGNYAVEVTLNGCTDTSDCISIINVGVGANTISQELVVFPSPVKDALTIVLGNTYKNGYIEIRTLAGQLVKQLSVNAQSKVTIDSKGWAAGTYFVTVQNNTSVEVIKFIKE